MVWIILIAFLILVGVAAVVAASVFLFLRLRAGVNIRIPLRFLLRLYVYIILIVGLLLITEGASELLKAGLGAFDKDFSYEPVFVGFDREPRKIDPLELKDTKDLTDEELERLTEIRVEVQQKELELRREERRRGLDRAMDEGLIQGVSFTLIGVIIWGAHVVGRRKLETQEEAADYVSKIYLIVLVVIFGIFTLVNLPQGVFEGLRFYLLDPIDEFSRNDPPGGKLAISIVALPIWITYLMGTIRAVRKA